MNTVVFRPPVSRSQGFTLIELIGVMAIMAILASVVVPNALKSIDRVAVRAEGDSLKNVGDQVRLYIRDFGAPPTVAAWTTQLAAYSDFSSTALASNTRQMVRVYVLDTAASPAPRAMILSSMRNGLALPAAASINAARFDDIWQTASNTVPSGASAGLWSSWTAVDNSGDYLVIQRINLTSIYKTDLPSFTVILNNSGATGSVSYQLVRATGATVSGIVNQGALPVTLTMSSKDRLNLYTPASKLGYSYTGGSSNKTFSFGDTSGWAPQ